MSVPAGFTSSGLPIGMQIAGKPFDEATAFRVGYTYQEATRIAGQTRSNRTMAMTTKAEIALIAHLFRRAGFGATYDQLENYAARGYQAAVEELLHPEERPDVPLDLLQRYIVDWKDLINVSTGQTYWTYRMINSPRPLQEKISFFWHGVLCAGQSKCDNGTQMQVLVDKFRRHGLGRFTDLLVQLGRDPAMTTT